MARGEGPLLAVEHLSVSYGHIQALRDVSLIVREGETVTLIGSNGAGKSTLLSAILGIVRAQSGAIMYFDRNITGLDTDSIVSSGIAIVPEGRGIFPLMSIEENLLLGLYHVKGEKKSSLGSIYRQFPFLKDHQNRTAGTLSGGQQQILSIARALISRPRLLILDEPSLGLAPILVEELFAIIGDLKRNGITILLAEQNAWKALECADRSYVFESGRQVLEGNAKELEKDQRVRKAYLDL